MQQQSLLPLGGKSPHHPPGQGPSLLLAGQRLRSDRTKSWIIRYLRKVELWPWGAVAVDHDAVLGLSVLMDEDDEVGLRVERQHRVVPDARSVADALRAGRDEGG